LDVKGGAVVTTGVDPAAERDVRGGIAVAAGDEDTCMGPGFGLPFDCDPVRGVLTGEADPARLWVPKISSKVMRRACIRG
jgi:hypothetical protein